MTTNKEVEEILDTAKDQENNWFYQMPFENRKDFMKWAEQALQTYADRRVEEEREKMLSVMEKHKHFDVENAVRCIKMDLEDGTYEELTPKTNLFM